MGITIETVFKAYNLLEDEISALEAQIKEKKVVQEKRKDFMLAQLQKQGAQNIAFKGLGTIYQLNSESVSVADWDAALNWVKENEAWEFLNHAINKKAVVEYLGEDKTNLPPPGVNYVVIKKLGVRRG